MSFAREIEVARRAAAAAGKLALRHQAAGLKPPRTAPGAGRERSQASRSPAAQGCVVRGVSYEIKPDDSPVTAADQECERLIAAALEEAFPEDGILGEEGARKPSRNGRRWIVDPIDGTRDFIRGLPLWCVMIALEEEDEVKAGVVHLPPLAQTCWAARGGGAFRNGVALRASRISDPAMAVLSLNGLNKMSGQPCGAGVLQWAAQFWSVRSLGGTPDAMLVAAGEAEVWIEAGNLGPWDLAAPQVILEEAGAIFFDFLGRRSIYGGHAAACAPGLERELRAFLKISGNA